MQEKCCWSRYSQLYSNLRVHNDLPVTASKAVTTIKAGNTSWDDYEVQCQ